MSRREFGWNDPPQFSYNDSNKVGGTRGGAKLNKRPTYPADQRNETPPTTSTCTPPLSSLPPPPLTVSIKSDDHIETTPINTETTPPTVILKSDVMTTLYELSELYKDKIEERLYKEINRRLNILDSQWDTLNIIIHTKLNQLIKALKDNDFKSAESIHVALMVDHVTEVKQWLIGVKKLVTIATDHHNDS